MFKYFLQEQCIKIELIILIVIRKYVKDNVQTNTSRKCLQNIYYVK